MLEPNSIKRLLVWLASILPFALPITPIRQHDAFLSSYAPEDEGLYDDYYTR
jgi:hypothetical protein